MIPRRRGVPRPALVLYGVLLVLLPSETRAQLIFDLSAAWGGAEHTMDAGVGYSPFSGLSILAGGALVERGLEVPYVWNADRTRIIDPGNPSLVVDPRDARTAPDPQLWARLEYQPQWWGAMAMWDPRSHFALGAFGSVKLTARSELIGELRWVHTLGHDLSVRLRWR